MMSKNKKKGFTIIELVIVIAVIAILAAVMIPTFTNVVKKANISAALSNARNAYEEYLADNVEDMTASDDYVIVSGSYAFVVEDNEFKTTETEVTVGTTTVTTKSGTTDVTWTITSSGLTSSGYEAVTKDTSVTTADLYKITYATAS